MPTVGWIQETAIDQFYERGGTSAASPKLSEYFCRHCGKCFSSKDARDLHEVEHPIANPVLIVDGLEVQRSTFKLSQSPKPESIELAFVEYLVVNGKCVEMGELKDWLCSAKYQFFNIELHGNETTKRISIDVQIADPAELLQVDQKFRTYFSDDDFNGDDVMRFTKDTEHLVSCVWYRDGLVKYLYGVMAKDQRTERLTYKNFSDALNQSFTLLSGYDTPLAVSLCQLIKFVMNDFRIPNQTGYIPALDNALIFFNSGIVTNRKWQRNDGQLCLPIDLATEVILNQFIGLYEELSIKEMVEHLGQINRKNWSRQDKHKLDYIFLRKSIDDKDIERETYYKRRVRHLEEFNYVFDIELEG